METEKTQEQEPEFDAFAESYDEALNEGLKLSGENKEFFARGRMEWLKNLLTELQTNPDQALDFGCGTGSATPFFFDVLEIEKLIGIDPSKASLEQARKSWADYNATFAAQYSSSESLLDLGFCNGVFHHISPPERSDAAKSVYEALRPGAIFAFWENNPWNPVTRYAMSRVPFDDDAILVWPRQAKSLLRSVGFEILRTDYVFFFPGRLACCRPLEQYLRWLPLGGQYLVLAQKPEITNPRSS